MQTQESAAKPISQEQWHRFVVQVASKSTDHDPRRINPREPFQSYEDVKLNLQLAGEVEQRTARITEVSVGGVTCWTDAEVPVCVKVTFQFHPENEPIRLRGKIVHCTQTVGGYKVGIELEFPR